jgi:hypothetical protein
MIEADQGWPKPRCYKDLLEFDGVVTGSVQAKVIPKADFSGDLI